MAKSRESKLKDFEVQGFVKAWQTRTIKAESLEQALQIARELTANDFVDDADGASGIDCAYQLVSVAANDAVEL